MTNLKHLRELCDAATDELVIVPREPTNEMSMAGVIKLGLMFPDKVDPYIALKSGYPQDIYRAMIAATDPTTVQALIDEIERLRQELEICMIAFNSIETLQTVTIGGDVRDERIRFMREIAKAKVKDIRQALKGTDDE